MKREEGLLGGCWGGLASLVGLLRSLGVGLDLTSCPCVFLLSFLVFSFS